MHEMAWWLFTLAGLFAFFLSYRKVVPQQDSIKASFNCVLRVSKGLAPQILRVLTFKWIASVEMFRCEKKTAKTDSVALRIGIEILLMTGNEKVRRTGEN